jgi:hypothetical protein
LLGGGLSVFGQPANISGVVNKYTRITQLALFDGNGLPHGVVVSDTTDFSAGDTVIVYQPKGFQVKVTDQGGITGFLDYTGKYSVLIIKKIHPDKTVEFFVPIFYFIPVIDRPQNYKPGETGMLIKVPTYEQAVVTGEINAADWNTDSLTGGVVALYVKRKLSLQADIDVSGQGFKGADPGTEQYGNGCFSDDPVGFSKEFFPETASDSAGLKGEGAAGTNFTLLRGRGRMINGGGGGNARYSGGGGGSNYTAGGRGGFESNLCAAPSAQTYGRAGAPFNVTSSAEYRNWSDPGDLNNHYKANRIFFGGGGGTGTQDLSFPASRGGNGGGIVIIITDTLEMDPGAWIRADGESVADTVSGAGGGGGAGGTIIIDANHYQGTINLSARGGNGGWTNNDAYETGPGGGGGGGIYWLRKWSEDITLNQETSSGGQDKGIQSAADAFPGGFADTLLQLNTPLDGFLFNILPGDTAVCNNIIPDPIDASSPKGGDGVYAFTWQYHDLDNPNDTTTITGAGEDFIFTEPLTKDRKFWRIVQSGEIIEGDPTLGAVPEAIIYYVLDSIEGDDIILQRANDSLICEGVTPLSIIQNPGETLVTDAGTTTVSYSWFQRANTGTEWGTSIATEESFDPPALSDSTWYLREVVATKGTFPRGHCVSKDSLRINVLPAITGNIISSDTILCQGQHPDLLQGPKPGGGDQAVFTYQWQQSEINQDASFADTSGIDTRTFLAPDLESTMYYRRIYSSGNNGACVDTSNVVTITVLESIENNTILVDSGSDSICQGSTVDPIAISGSLPEKGDGIYRYVWETREWDAGTWSNAGFPGRTAPDLAALDDTTMIRRIVLSGDDDVCQDTSNMISIKVISQVNNNTITTSPFTVCQDITLPLLDAEAVTGGDGTFGYLWESSATGTADWVPATGGVNNTFEDLDPGSLLQTTYFRRKAWSDAERAVCLTISDTLLVTVQPRIDNNLISHPLNYVCFDGDLQVSGTDENSTSVLTGGAGPPFNYSWQESTDPAFAVPSVIGTGRDYLESNYTNQRFFRRIVTSGECADTTLPLEIVVKRLPFATLSLADGEYLSPCEFDPVVFDLEFRGEEDVTAYTATIAFDTTGGSGSFSDLLTENPATMEHLPATDDSTVYTYYLSGVEDSNGCFAPADSMIGTVLIKVYQTPVSEIAVAPDSVCGPVVSLEAVSDRGGTGHWEKTAGLPSVTFSQQNDEFSDATIDPLDTDEQELTYAWILSTPRCSDTAYATVIHFLDPDPPPYFSRDTVPIYFADEYMLQALPPTAGSGTWSVAEGSFGYVDPASTTPETLATDLELSASLKDEDLNPNTFAWTVQNGACGPYRDEITIVRLDVTQYDGFSPNSDDMLNRYYVMRGAGDAEDFVFTVFNSWGTVIKTISKSDAEMMGRIDQGSGPNAVEDELILWDGTAADGVTLVPDGTYYYNIKLMIGDETYYKKGYILVKTRK